MNFKKLITISIVISLLTSAPYFTAYAQDESDSESVINSEEFMESENIVDEMVDSKMNEDTADENDIESSEDADAENELEN